MGVRLVTVADGMDGKSRVSAGDQPGMIFVGMEVPLITRFAPSPDNRTAPVPAVPFRISVPPDETVWVPARTPPEEMTVVPPAAITVPETVPPLRITSVFPDVTL